MIDAHDDKQKTSYGIQSRISTFNGFFHFLHYVITYNEQQETKRATKNSFQAVIVFDCFSTPDANYPKQVNYTCNSAVVGLLHGFEYETNLE
jgi:hypothetical protein